MGRPSTADLVAPLTAQRDQIAAAWYTALSSLLPPTHTPAAAQLLLRTCTDQLLAALADATDPATPAQQIGVQLATLTDDIGVLGSTRRALLAICTAVVAVALRPSLSTALEAVFRGIVTGFTAARIAHPDRTSPLVPLPLPLSSALLFQYALEQLPIFVAMLDPAGVVCWVGGQGAARVVPPQELIGQSIHAILIEGGLRAQFGQALRGEPLTTTMQIGPLQFALTFRPLDAPDAAPGSTLVLGFELAGPTALPSVIVPPLTAREQQIIRLLAAGHTDAQIGRALGLAARTVRHQLRQIMGTAAVGSRVALVGWAARHGLLG